MLHDPYSDVMKVKRDNVDRAYSIFFIHKNNIHQRQFFSRQQCAARNGNNSNNAYEILLIFVSCKIYVFSIWMP